jgi:D-hydroxyproline dehydrogenase subunit gamma
VQDGSNFRRLPEGNAAASPGGDSTVSLSVDGRTIAARRTDTVAAAMLAAGIHVCRTTPVSGAPRAPYCMMGVCFECLVTIDGMGNRQGCLIPVREGMQVLSQQGKRRMDESDAAVHGAQEMP